MAETASDAAHERCAAASPLLRSAVRRFGLAAVVVVVIAATYWRIFGFGLLGFDTYPIIVTSRVTSPADFFDTFTQPLMDDRYAGGFYRPLVNLTFAFDYALWGIDHPAGYHATDLLAFTACALALYAFVRRLAPDATFIAPLVATLYFVLHPAQYEVVPVPGRRPESLAGLFMLLALWSQLSPRALERRRVAVLPAAFTLLAIASKETAFVLPILVMVAVYLYSPRPGWSGRVVHALVAAVPHAVVAGLMLLARVAVLGGLGGHGPVAGEEVVAWWPRVLGAILDRFLFPQAPMRAAAVAHWLALALLVGLVVVASLAIAERHSRLARTKTATTARAIGVASVWVVVVAGIYLASGRLEPWYTLLPLIGFAVAVGIVADRLVDGVRRGGAAQRASAAVTLVLFGLLIGWHVRYSPLFHDYDAWRRATQAAAEFETQLRAQIERAGDGEAIAAPPVPIWVPAAPEAPAIRGAAILMDYSIQAWVELAFPVRAIRVVPYRGQMPVADPRELVVVLVSRRPGF